MKSIIVLFVLLFINNNIFAVERNSKSTIPNFKPTLMDRKKMDINTIDAWFRNDGEFFSDHSTTGPGFEWPKGGKVHAIFSSSMWIGAKIEGKTHVATVGHFGSEFRPGMMIEGKPDDYNKEIYRYYRVRPLEDTPETNRDFLEWPVAQGAPWFDKNRNGIYEPNDGDRPALAWGGEAIYPDILMFSVYNDADPAYHNWIWGQSPPLGAEVRQTSWAYNRIGPFGQMIFMRFEVINKSDKNWDSTYLVVWSDPDLGDAFDDYVCVDTTTFDKKKNQQRNLGICYNGEAVDAPNQYGNIPPAVGYKYFQGPKLFTGNLLDSAYWSGNLVPRYKNLNISGFNMYCNPGTGGCTNPDYWDPSRYNQTYNIMKGLTPTGKEWLDPTTNLPTKFVFPGDPVTGVGWLQQSVTQPTDVRFTMPAGPFTMSAGDTQQVVIGAIVARGSNYLTSITTLRQYADISQALFDNNFKLPPAPQAPKVTASWSNESIILSWDKEAEKFLNPDPKFRATWKFHAYNIYQTDDPLLRPTAKIERIGSYYIPGGAKIIKDSTDLPGVEGEVLKTVWEGETEGLVNYLNLTTNKLTAKPFILGRPYYFIITAMAYGDTAPYKLGMRMLESPMSNIITVIPRNPVSGTIFPSGTYNQLIKHDRWLSDENYDDGVQIKVIDPWRTQSGKYKITFDGTGIDVTSWKLWQMIGSDNDSLLAIGTNFKNDENFPIVSNVMPKIIKLPIGVRRRSQSPPGLTYKGSRWFTGVRGMAMDDSIDARGIAAYPTKTNFIASASKLRSDSLRRVEIRFSTTHTQKAYRYVSNLQIFPPKPPVHPEYAKFIPNLQVVGYGYQDYNRYRLNIPDSGWVVPFTVWEVDKIHNTNRQLDIAIVERNDSLYSQTSTPTNPDTTIYLNYGNVDGRWMPTSLTRSAIREGDEVLIIFGTDYSDSAKTMYTGTTTPLNLQRSLRNLPAMYAVWMKKRDDKSTFKEGDVAIIQPNYTISADKVFKFEVLPPKVGFSEIAKQREELKRIKVVPNPYYASHELQTDAFDNYITFTNLPAKSKIRIFNLAGDMINYVEHDFGGQINNSSARWNLKNHAGIPVASGMYIAHIEGYGLDEQGKEMKIGDKVLKFAVFIQEERLDTF